MTKNRSQGDACNVGMFSNRISKSGLWWISSVRLFSSSKVLYQQ